MNLKDCLKGCEKAVTGEYQQLSADLHNMSTDHRWALAAGVFSLAGIVLLGEKFKAAEEAGSGAAAAFVERELPQASSLLPQGLEPAANLTAKAAHIRQSVIEVSEGMTGMVNRETGSIRQFVRNLAQSDMHLHLPHSTKSVLDGPARTGLFDWRAPNRHLDFSPTAAANRFRTLTARLHLSGPGNAANLRPYYARALDWEKK